MSSTVLVPYYLKSISSPFFEAWFNQMQHQNPEAREAIGDAVEIGRVDMALLPMADRGPVLEALHRSLVATRADRREFRYGQLEQRLAAWQRDRATIGESLMDDLGAEAKPGRIMVSGHVWTAEPYLFGVVLAAATRAGMLTESQARALAADRTFDPSQLPRGRQVLLAAITELLDGGLGYPLSWFPELPDPAFDETGKLLELRSALKR